MTAQAGHSRWYISKRGGNYGKDEQKDSFVGYGSYTCTDSIFIEYCYAADSCIDGNGWHT